MRIDSHQHFTAEYSPALLWPILKRNRFDATVLVGPSSLLPYADADYVKAVVLEVDPLSGDLPKALDDFQRHPKFRGVCYSGPDAPPAAALAELARRDLTLDLPPRPELVPPIAERHPALRIALGYVGRPSLMPDPLDAWVRDLELAAAHPELCVKVAGLITDSPARWRAEDLRPAVQSALRILGPGRIMYGSDWPSYLPEGTWKEALAAFTQSIGAVPSGLREHLLGLTAARFYRIPVGDAA